MVAVPTADVPAQEPSTPESEAAEGRTWGVWGARPPNMMTGDPVRAFREHRSPEPVGRVGLEPTAKGL
jgi:hypothetical protein